MWLIVAKNIDAPINRGLKHAKNRLKVIQAWMNGVNYSFAAWTTAQRIIAR